MSVICQLVLPLILLAYLVSKLLTPKAAVALNVPTVTFGRFVPNSVNRLLFFVGGRYLVYKGYKKVQYKDVPFRILKVDADVIVLPAKYLPQIRSLGHSHVSLVDAQSASICGEYLNILQGTNLPSLTVVKKLTPALSKWLLTSLSTSLSDSTTYRIMPKLINELDHAFAIELPECKAENWAQINLYFTILKLITRSTSRVIAGETLCRDEKWLSTVTKYSEQLGITLVFLRPLPPFLRPLAAKILPSVRYLSRTLEYVKDELFVPIILARCEAETYDSDYQKPDDFIQWMMDTAESDFDKEPGNIAYGVMAIMALAITHTTTMLITQGIYDLLIRPEYLEPLRREITITLKDGWANASVKEFTSQRLLDSFLRESQRLNPSSEYNVHRITKQPLTLTDGFFIPENTYIVFPSGPLSRDASIINDPEVFDGYRWCNDHMDTNMDKARTMSSLVTINESNLHFGYGREACPGRFFAAHASKAILSRLLVEYDIRFLDGKEGVRPANIRNGEHIMPNIFTKVLIRRRGVAL
ncbi:hypothetical protein BDV12DRAFT_201351 [Aspergillus spectabilis]